MTLSLRQLRYFVAIADCGALSHAAQGLNVAQSALSHHVAQLEATLGLTLLERKARGVSLTAAGKRLYEHATTIVANVEAAVHDMRTFSETPSGTIAVGLSHTAVDHVALSLMRSARETCPGVVLTIREGLSADLIAQVVSGSLDLALVFNPAEDSRLDQEPLLEEDLFLIGTPELIGGTADPIRFSDLPKRPILAPYQSGTLRAIIDDHLLRNRIEPSDLLQIDSLTTLRLALENGLGSSILGRSSVWSGLRDGRIHARQIVEPTLSRRLAQVWLRTRPKTRALAEIARLASASLVEAVEDGRWPARLLT